MIKATSNAISNETTKCRVEFIGSGKVILKEYRAITVSVYKALRACMPEESARNILMEEVNRAVKEGNHEYIKDHD